MMPTALAPVQRPLASASSSFCQVLSRSVPIPSHARSMRRIVMPSVRAPQLNGMPFRGQEDQRPETNEDGGRNAAETRPGGGTLVLLAKVPFDGMASCTVTHDDQEVDRLASQASGRTEPGGRGTL